jgi:hypothetical protein
MSRSSLTVERRLEDERLQIEAKKREREEQHLFLTAKVRNFLGSIYLFLLLKSLRSLPMIHLLAMKALILPRLMKRTGRRRSYRVSVF